MAQTLSFRSGLTPLARAIYEQRSRMGLSQDELADRLFVRDRSVRRWLTGMAPRKATRRHLIALARKAV